MQITQTQARLVRFAEQHYARAVPREEGDVAIFTELGFPSEFRGDRNMCEIDVVANHEELRAVLGY